MTWTQSIGLSVALVGFGLVVSPVNAQDKEGDAPVEATLPLLQFPDHLNVQDVVFSKDGQTIHTVATRGGLTRRSWEVATGELVSEVELETEIHGNHFLNGTLRFSGDGEKIVASGSGVVHVWNAQNGKRVATSIPEELRVSKVVISSSGRLLATVGSNFDLQQDVEVTLWDTKTGEKLRSMNHVGGLQLHHLNFSPDETLLVTASQENGLMVWEVESGELLNQFNLKNNRFQYPLKEEETSLSVRNQVLSVAFSPNSRFVASTDLFGVKLWDVSSNKLVRVYHAPFRYGRSRVVFSPGGELFARCDTDQGIRIWSTEDRKELDVIHHQATCLAFSPQSNSIVVGFGHREKALALFEIK